MSCARWITCPPLYSVEAIEASVEASVEASIEVASRLSVEAASRRRGQGSAASPSMGYSPSFDFVQLRFCPRCLHTAREATTDARSSAGEDGRCARW